MTSELDALEYLNLADWAPVRDEMWTLPDYHVDGLHPEVTRRLLKALNTLVSRGQPLASVIRGERGSGKTHLLCWLREEVQKRNGYFFPMKPVTGYSAWHAAVDGVFNGLLHPAPEARDQVTRLLTTLSDAAKLDPVASGAVLGHDVVERRHVDALVEGVRLLDRQVGIQAADTLRALVLIASSGPAVEVGRDYFTQPENYDEARDAWGISAPRPAQLVLRDLTHLIALGGPIVFAFDQLDGLIHESNRVMGSTRQAAETASARKLRDDIATTLMELREESRRTLLVVACQFDTWETIAQSSLLSAQERFDLLPELGAIPDIATARAIVSARLGPRYAEVEFVPDYATWPIAESALREVPHRFSARRLLMRIAEHVTGCLAVGEAKELVTVTKAELPKRLPESGHLDLAAQDSELRSLTEKFDQYCAAADEEPLSESVEDRTMPLLIGAGLRSLVHELGGEPRRFEVDQDFGASSELHARLRYTVDETTDQEIHWSFRAVAATNALRFQTRLAKAMRTADLAHGQSSRSFLLIRNSGFPSGPKTAEMMADFRQRGGLERVINSADLRKLSALRTMLDEHPTGLMEWLRAMRPASKLEIFAEIVDSFTSQTQGPQIAKTVAANAAEDLGDEVIAGDMLRDGKPFGVSLAALRKHSIVIGSTGSGKTVLVRHLVEQCALRGVSSIVLDPNEDLASLGDARPVPPEGWSADQHNLTSRYFATTEVLVWTPGLRNGRPISFHPLPDFNPVRDDPDGYERLVDATVSDLASQARVTGKTPRAVQQRSILKRSLNYYVSNGGAGLSGFLAVLNDLPDGIGNARIGARLASEMAATLEAVTDIDPLFGEKGTPVDPRELLTPHTSKAARISVISLIGLRNEARQSFVGRLLTALFAYFRANPVRGETLGGLLVMDEAQNFVPSGAATQSSEITRELIAQIRKYGLGVVLATQMPKGLHNSVPGNTANQFIGRLSVPAQVAAAAQMAQARGSTLDRLGKLEPGVFYAATEGGNFSRIQAPLCLSHHREALREEEVLERAQRAGHTG